MYQKLHYKNFVIACIISAITALLLFYFSASMGKHAFFLFLNNNYGLVADYFFKFYTHLGDGSLWILFLILFIKYRKKYIPFLISAFIISTLLVQICKYIILPDEPRPITAIQPTSLIHVVEGIDVHTTSTFPSGHTAAAFSYFFIACLFVANPWVIVIGFIYAALAGYSRIYIAQHFPFDVAAGIVTAIIAVGLSILVQQFFEKKR